CTQSAPLSCASGDRFVPGAFCSILWSRRANYAPILHLLLAGQTKISAFWMDFLRQRAKKSGGGEAAALFHSKGVFHCQRAADKTVGY
ncbi:MAG: hypothetical protein LUF80_03090, partial [Oscillospiraceae bacterium]|nr:hypothetical protein [Oscillospiraceae bacterium]